MSLVYSVIICLCFKASSCQLQCVKETPDDKEFSINVTEHVTAESGNCIWILYEFTFPTNKVTAPYKKIWFKGDSQTNVGVIGVHNVNSGTKDTFRIDGLPHGEYEYGFKLEWGCNQTYVFPKRVKISVSALTQKPIILVPLMKEGRVARLTCMTRPLCSARANIYWKQTKADGQTMVLNDYHKYTFRYNTLHFIPTADDHNTNITCVAEYDYNVIEATVTITVNFPPKILNGSQCMLEGTVLVCVCISQGNPLPPITWPLASFTDFSVSSYSNTQTVNSTLTMRAADYHNTTVKCISSNELGQAEVEMPLQNCTQRQSYWFDSSQKLDTAHSWVTAMSLTLNLVLLTSLIICTYKWRKSMQKKRCEELKTYTSLKKANVEQDYNIITPLPR